MTIGTSWAQFKARNLTIVNSVSCASVDAAIDRAILARQMAEYFLANGMLIRTVAPQLAGDEYIEAARAAARAAFFELSAALLSATGTYSKAYLKYMSVVIEEERGKVRAVLSSYLPVENVPRIRVEEEEE